MKKLINLSLYLVTEREGLSLDAFYSIIDQGVQGGVTAVQLREKGISKREFIAIGRMLVERLRPWGVPVIVNDSIEVAFEIGAAGVHLGQSDANVDEARRVLGRGGTIGLSVETLEQAFEAEDLDVDYIAASPVFLTESKLDANKPWGLEGLRTLCQVSRHPVVGIGGINLQNIEAVIGAGASGVALISAIFKSELPCEAAKELMIKIKESRKL